MSERIVPTPEQIVEVLEAAYKAGNKAPPDWIAPRIGGLMLVRKRLKDKGIPDDVATEAVLLSALRMGSIFERANFDVDPKPFLDPRRN